ncbi:hypothetical protein P171DRAFT_156243 [Karstenula rhodostoma CBS 690.94]|uniref:Uncharacterized protein n=1 Tax=Karstenula rhodostoma CBS 690.94 TaxID=1392251 RepID=A0A9P4U588_9PLEO|nr:hypothetical protein P171DRAFT_156243 [Karstenula rhodostoma CBS 690.94]
MVRSSQMADPLHETNLSRLSRSRLRGVRPRIRYRKQHPWSIVHSRFSWLRLLLAPGGASARGTCGVSRCCANMNGITYPRGILTTTRPSMRVGRVAMIIRLKQQVADIQSLSMLDLSLARCDCP